MSAAALGRGLGRPSRIFRPRPIRKEKRGLFGKKLDKWDRWDRWDKVFIAFYYVTIKAVKGRGRRPEKNLGRDGQAVHKFR